MLKRHTPQNYHDRLFRVYLLFVLAGPLQAPCDAHNEFLTNNSGINWSHSRPLTIETNAGEVILKPIESDARGLFYHPLVIGSSSSTSSRVEHIKASPVDESGKSSGNVDDQVNRGKSLLHSSKFREAIQCFDQAIQNNPDCAEYYALKASCLYGQELFEQALNEYLKAEKLEPAEASYRLSVAMCLSRLNRFEEAKREIAAAHRNHGENTALSHLCLAELYAQKNEFTKAIRECDKSLVFAPSNDDALMLKASCFASMHKYSLAEDVVNAGLRDSSSEVRFLLLRVDLEMHQKKYEQALHHIEQALKIEPEFAAFYAYKAAYCESIGKGQEALELYKKARDLGDENLDETICALLLKQNQIPQTIPYIVKFTRHTADTDSVKEEVTKSFSELPEQAQKDLVSFGLRITVSPTITEYLPELENVRPRGYAPTYSWKNVPAYYAGSKGVVVAERIVGRDGQTKVNEKAYFSALHEFGHAYDACKGQVSRCRQFKEDYARDCKLLTELQRKRNSYFLQPGITGRHECFAALFEFNYSQQAGLPQRYPHLAEDFPNCFEFVKSLCPPNPNSKDEQPLVTPNSLRVGISEALIKQPGSS